MKIQPTSEMTHHIPRMMSVINVYSIFDILNMQCYFYTTMLLLNVNIIMIHRE